MSRAQPAALRFSHQVLRGLLVLNLLYGLAILVLLAASLVAEGPVFRALGVEPAPDRDQLVLGMRLIMVIGIASVPIAYVILARLLAIVDAVRAGDPFVMENARHLQTIAWSVLGLELLHVAVGAVAANVGSRVQPLDIDWSFSITPWLSVLLLFVLARVFDEGARMRADLEGTV